jgi:DMSO/TMAO reductase YedYZ heme-binding membrane subunit
MNFRKLHRKIAPIIFIPLALTALTGVLYRLGDSWFDIGENIGELFLAIHQGSYLGKELRPMYVLLVGLGTIALIVTGFTMMKLFNKSASNRPVKKVDFRQIHKWVAPIVFLPLAMSAVTGIIFRVGRAWFNMSKDTGEILLELHQGKYFGEYGESIYVILVGVGSLVLLVTGIEMTGIFRPRRTPKGEDS